MSDDDDFVDITPPTRLLHSLRAGGPANYTALAGEAIDNAFDAKATCAELTITDTDIRIADNGQGVLPENIGKLFTPGGHQVLETTRLGRYGVGIKIQALRAGDALIVNSVYDTGKFQAPGNWVTILHSSQWRIPKPRPFPVAVGTPTGTEIIITELVDAPKYSLEDLRRDIAMMFRPALTDGRNITVNGVQLRAIPDPAMTDIVTAEREFDLDRSITVTAGMVGEDAALKLVHVGFEHRIIFAAKRIGCGAYQGISGLYAKVQLRGKWKLGQFKDDLYDEREKRELEDALEDILHPLLEKCAEASQLLRYERLILELNNLVPEKIAARPHRGPDKNPRSKGRHPSAGHGTVDPDKSDVATSGPARSQRRTPAKLLIEIEPGTPDSIGEFDASGKLHRVILYSHNPAVAGAIEQRGRDRRSLYWLMSYAGSLYFSALDAERTIGRQGQLPNIEGTFGERMAWFLANVTADVKVLRA